MKLIVSSEDYYQAINNLLDAKPIAVSITTYGFWAGITAAGLDVTEFCGRFEMEGRKILERLVGMPQTKVDILVGLYAVRSCKGKNEKCPHCEGQYVKNLLRLLAHAEKFSKFNWRVSTDCHTKCILCAYRTRKGHDRHDLIALAGSKNFTDSETMDISFLISEPANVQEMADYTMRLHNLAMPLTIESIRKIMADNEISKEGAALAAHV